jgi:hypothetical protein
MNFVSPFACFAALEAARAHRRPSVPLQRQAHCAGCCTRVPEEIFTALDCAYPPHPAGSRDLNIGPRQVAALIAPLMASGGWRFCRCYRAGLTPEHRFISRLIDTAAANAAAESLAGRS